jgi:hypothetical protein
MKRDLDPRVAAIGAHFVSRLASAIVDDVRARYDFGHALHTVRYAPPAAYGPNAMRELASAVQIDASALRRNARVSETIAPDELHTLTGLRNGAGLPLTWSHLEVLSTVRSAGRRESLAVAAAAERLSVRALASLISGERG